MQGDASMSVSTRAAFAAAAAALITGGGAAAFEPDGPFAVEVGYGFYNANSEVGDGDLNMVVARGRYRVADYLDIELEGATSFDEDEAETDAFTGALVPADLSITSSFGLFSKGLLDLGERSTAYGRVGVVSTEFEAESVEFGDDSDRYTGLGVGLGLETDLVRGIAVRGDYTRHQYEDASINAVSLSLICRFGG